MVPRVADKVGLLRLVASVLLPCLCGSAWAQAPDAASAPAADPPGPAAPLKSPGPSTGRALPTIEVTAKRKPAPAVRTKRAQAATSRAPSAPPPSPYETGAPNVAGGNPAVPQLASQMTVSGADLNARPATRPGEILEAAPGLMVVMHADGGKAVYSISCAVTISTTALTWPHSSTTYRSTCRPTRTVRAIPTSTFSFPRPSARWTCARGPISPTSATSPTPEICTSGCATASTRTSNPSPSAALATSDLSPWVRPRRVTARCSMPANSTPTMAHGRRPTI